MTAILLHDGPHRGDIVEATVNDGSARYFGWVANMRVELSTTRFTPAQRSPRCWPEPQGNKSAEIGNVSDGGEVGMGAGWDPNPHRRDARLRKANRLADFVAGNMPEFLSDAPAGPDGLRLAALLLETASSRRLPEDQRFWSDLAVLADVNDPSLETQRLVVELLRARAAVDEIPTDRIFEGLA